MTSQRLAGRSLPLPAAPRPILMFRVRTERAIPLFNREGVRVTSSHRKRADLENSRRTEDQYRGVQSNGCGSDSFVKVHQGQC